MAIKKVRFIFAWFDFWVGLFWDANKKRLYFFPIPMFGLMVQMGPTKQEIQEIIEKGKAGGFFVINMGDEEFKKLKQDLKKKTDILNPNKEKTL